MHPIVALFVCLFPVFLVPYFSLSLSLTHITSIFVCGLSSALQVPGKSLASSKQLPHCPLSYNALLCQPDYWQRASFQSGGVLGCIRLATELNHTNSPCSRKMSVWISPYAVWLNTHLTSGEKAGNFFLIFEITLFLQTIIWSKLPKLFQRTCLKLRWQLRLVYWKSWLFRKISVLCRS